MMRNTNRLLGVTLLAIAGVTATARAAPGDGAAPTAPAAPAAPAARAAAHYTADGKLGFPSGYREWIFLSSGLDMSYTDQPPMDGGSMFDNVFVNADAYGEFRRSGTWPDHTMLILESRGAATRGSINKHGQFQTVDRMGVEVHVKDVKRFAGGWAFFAFDGTQPATRIPTSESCYACHQQHAAVDTTFVQFYPTLLGIAQKKGTLTRGYSP